MPPARREMPPDSRTLGVSFDLLCRMVGPSPGLEQLRRALHKGIDFPQLLQVASDHSVRPQLIGTLAALSWESVPPSVRTDLEAFRRLHVGFCLAAADQLARLVAALAARGIRVAAFKGATLAAALYGDLAAREYNDIDLIVPPSQLDEAEDVVLSFGYRGAQGDRRFRRAFLSYQGQYMFVRAGQPAVDLHWAFTGSHLPFPLAAEEIWRSLDVVRIGPHDVPAVVGADLPLLLAGHGTKEAWQSLGWICDFALVVERRRDLDWLALHTRARHRGCGDSLLLACAMADRLLGVAMPAALTRAVAASWRVGRLAEALVGDLRKGVPAPAKKRDLADLDLCDRAIDRLGVALRVALTPTAGDHAALPLPPLLWPAYRLIRPFRLAAKAFGRR